MRRSRATSLVVLSTFLITGYAVAGGVTVTFDGLTETTPIPTAPATHLTNTSPTFEISRMSINDTVQLDNLNHASGGPDYELRFSVNFGRSVEVTFRLENGALFDFTSFDLEAIAGSGTTLLEFEAFRDGASVGLVENPVIVDTYDYSGRAAFQGIDEMRIFYNASSTGSQVLFDNFVFGGIVPGPGAIAVLLPYLGAAGARRARRRG